MNCEIKINGRRIGAGHPAYVIAELSANHGQDFNQAVEIIRAMKESGADAVKVQTYTADTLTIRSEQPCFKISGGTLWDGKTLHDLYQEAAMPWDWQPKLQRVAADLGMDFFSSPFDATAVDFLEQLNVPAYKIASFEMVDLPLIEKVARTGKPIIISTGMATLEEIEEAVATARNSGCKELALLKCTSSYPALPEEMDLRTIPDLSARFQVPIGLSDHTLGATVPIAAVSLGACIVEKHFTLSRKTVGPDSAFSLEPAEFKSMVEAIRATEKSLGKVNYKLSPNETKSRQFRRSLFVVEDVKAGEFFTEKNVRSIRPGHGLHTRHTNEVMGKPATRNIQRGTPLAWELVETNPTLNK